MKKIIIFSVIFFTILISVIYYFFEIKLNEKAEIIGNVKVIIPKGSSIIKSIEIVNNKELLLPSFFFKLYARIYAKSNNAAIFAGYYKFDEGITNLGIIKSLFNADNLYISRITIPEGLDIKRIKSIISKSLLLKIEDFSALTKSDSLLKARKISGKSVEGYLMPNTYDFFKEISAKELIDFLLNEQEKVWKKEIAPLVTDENKFTKHQILTLASIVEAESANPAERPIIAGLYLNRLRIGMPLQADPTISYAIGEKRRLLYSDLDISSPFNTYRNKGLPPGPINNPGAESIKAVLKPAKHNYLYMVAVGDGSGKHNFSQTKAEHDKFVKIYKKNRGL